MDARGTCYVSVVPYGSGVTGGHSASTDSTILRLAPGDGAQPEVVATLGRQFVGMVAVFPTSQPDRLALSVVSMPIPAAGGPIDFYLPSLLVTTVPG